jgi:hypothetical protein
VTTTVVALVRPFYFFSPQKVHCVFLMEDTKARPIYIPHPVQLLVARRRDLEHAKALWIYLASEQSPNGQGHDYDDS